MSKKPQYYRAKEAFATMYDGELTHVPVGEIVSAGHPLLKRREVLFEPVESFGRYDTGSIEQATAAPGEKRALPRRKRRSAPKKPKADKAAAAKAAPAAGGLKTTDIQPIRSPAE